MLCTTKGKHQIKHFLGEHIRPGSHTEFCPALGSCPHSISKRIDSHKEDAEHFSPWWFALFLGLAQGGREQHFSPTWHPLQLCTHLCF